MSNDLRLVYFATSNKHKFDEAKDILADYGIDLKMVREKTEEIQDDDLRTIAVHALSKALEKDERPTMIEDAGLFVKMLNGFPGPYSSYVHRVLGVDGILRLMNHEENRDAEFRSVVAFGNSPSIIETFQGVVKGTISLQPKGRSGFGFDPIFIPKGSKKTFAEMSLEEKNHFSHRADALRKFAKWYTSL
ncbi:MAG: XTP/dITP diphosphatase [archaeon]|nr:XTP/dITP diphosphatase [archaeon]MCP8306635.1 XTP/dITP diphosphatase [archaeon]